MASWRRRVGGDATGQGPGDQGMSANIHRLLEFVEDRLDHGAHDLIKAEDIPRLRAIAQGNLTSADAPQFCLSLLNESQIYLRDGVLPFDLNSTTVAPDGPGAGRIHAELLMPPGSLPLPPPVVVTVSGCEPLNDARELYQYLEEYVNQEGWIVDDTQLAGLAELAEARDELVGARDKLTTFASDIGDDILLGGAVTDDVPLLSGDFKAALARVLKLPEGMELPKDFESPLLAPAIAGRERIHGELINLRADLAALKQHVEEQWLPWANDRLSSAGVIGDQILLDME
uniref:Uncharacterized protein n=2 Tax=Oryza TaxID=4527 RepID=A0A0D3HML7_9ORYZ